MTFLSELGTLFLSSFLILVFIYFRISITNLQQIIIGVLIIFIIFFDRLFLSATKPLSTTLHIFVLFLTSFSIQVLIFSTGGFYSPFLVLFHLFAIATSFLVSIRVATAFLLFSISTLLIGTLIDPRLSTIFHNDYAAAILYILSFIVIIPLARVVADRYHIKDALSKILTQELKLTKIRQESVLEGLSDIVLITGIDLNILSVNEAAERGLRLSSSELINRSLFETLILKDAKNNVVDENYLDINQIIQDKAIHIIKDLLLFVRNSSMPKTVVMKVRPTINLEGRVDQIAFIISQSEVAGDKKLIHQDLQEAMLNHEAVLEDLKNKLLAKKMLDLSLKTELLGKAEKDLLTVLELQDHGLKPAIELKDVTPILTHIISTEDLFAKVVGVNLNFMLDNKYIQEAKLLIPSGSTFSPSSITSPYFTIPIDTKWFDLLMQKLLDIAILLVSGTKDRQIEVFLTYDSEFVYITFSIKSKILIKGDENLIFTEYYGRLGTNTNLHLGSGLEGYMAKTVASLLGIPLSVKIEGQNLQFKLQLSRNPHISS